MQPSQHAKADSKRKRSVAGALAVCAVVAVIAWLTLQRGGDAGDDNIQATAPGDSTTRDGADARAGGEANVAEGDGETDPTPDGVMTSEDVRDDGEAAAELPEGFERVEGFIVRGTVYDSGAPGRTKATLNAGTYIVRVDSDGYVANAVLVTLAAGDERDLDIALDPAATIELAVQVSRRELANALADPEVRRLDGTLVNVEIRDPAILEDGTRVYTIRNLDGGEYWVCPTLRRRSFASYPGDGIAVRVAVADGETTRATLRLPLTLVRFDAQGVGLSVAEATFYRPEADERSRGRAWPVDLTGDVVAIAGRWGVRATLPQDGDPDANEPGGGEGRVVSAEVTILESDSTASPIPLTFRLHDGAGD